MLCWNSEVFRITPGSKGQKPYAIFQLLHMSDILVLEVAVREDFSANPGFLPHFVGRNEKRQKLFYHFGRWDRNKLGTQATDIGKIELEVGRESEFRNGVQHI